MLVAAAAVGVATVFAAPFSGETLAFAPALAPWGSPQPFCPLQGCPHSVGVREWVSGAAGLP